MYDIEELDYNYWEQQEHIILPNYSNYIIYPKQGLVWSKKTNKWVGCKDKNGYWHCALYDDKGKIWRTVLHRVIWVAVNGDIPQDLQVNHLDENKDNNRIDNLELVTRKENINFGTHNERSAKARSKQVGAFKDGQLIMIFPSTLDADRQGYNTGAVSRCCNNCFNRQGNNTYKGYQWQYI